MEILELIAHPVRLRIIHAMRGDRVLTTGQLGAMIPDVSKAMLYRHVDLLASAGILEVVQEQRVRGAVERGYRLRDERALISAEDFKSLTREDHRRGFATAMAVLLAEYDAYLDRQQADPVADMVGYRQHAVWLTDDERAELISRMQDAIVPALANQSREDRKRYLLSPVMFPME